jgi:hypothetical protein
MMCNELLLERCTGNGRRRKHDGVIITLKPNLRWCSDSFEIRCWSGERARSVARRRISSPRFRELPDHEPCAVYRRAAYQ